MFIGEISSLDFVRKPATHTVHYDESAREWLKQWTPRGNLKLALAPTYDNLLQQLFEQEITPLFQTVSKNRLMGYKAEDFVFTVRHSEFEVGNTFWLPLYTYCYRYSCASGEKIS